MQYRHETYNAVDSIHFVTTVTRHRGRWFTDEATCRQLLTLFEYYRSKFGLLCCGYVLMPDHFHAVLRQTSEVGTVSKLMESFKRLSSRKVVLPGYTASSLWRDLFDDVPVPGPDAIRTKVHYAHWNAVYGGLVKNPEEYRWSSARFYFGISDQDTLIITMTPISF